jgi:hypothetical protein
METVNRQCAALKPDGSQCQAAALYESEFCFFHDPSRAAERHQAQALGGKQNRMKTLDSGAPNIECHNTEDIIALLTQTINQVRKGAIDPRIANSVGYLATITIKIFEHNDLENRIEKLEQATQRQTPGIDFAR